MLIHVEPETSFREPDDSDAGPFRSGCTGSGGGSRLTAAARPTATRVIV